MFAWDVPPDSSSRVLGRWMQSVTAASSFLLPHLTVKSFITQGKWPKRYITSIKEVMYRQYDGVGDKD